MCDVICTEAVPFRPCCTGVATRTRNVIEYMLVLALCLVVLLIVVEFVYLDLLSVISCLALQLTSRLGD